MTVTAAAAPTASTAATTAGTPELVLLCALMLAALVVPGLLIGLALTRRPGLSAAAAVPATVGVLGFFGWAFGGLGIPVNPLSLTLSWVFVLALALPLGVIATQRRRVRERLDAERDESYDPRRPGALGAGHARGGRGAHAVHRDVGNRGARHAGGRPGATPWAWAQALLSAGTVAALVVWASVDVARRIIEDGDRGLRAIPQGWDMHWHASLVHWVHETGVISPTRTGELRYAEDAKEVYYPTGWHVACDYAGEVAFRVTGRAWDTVEVINLFMAVSLAVAAAGSAAALVWIGAGFLLRRSGDTPLAPAAAATRWAATTLAAASALLLPAWQIIFFDGSWPAGFGIGLAGVAVAVTAAATVTLDARWAASTLAALAVLGAAQTHASAATVVAASLGLWLIQQLVRPAPGVTRLGALGHLILTAVLTAVPFAPQLLVGLGNVGEVTESTQQLVDVRSDSVAQALMLETKFFDFYGDDTVWYALIVAGLVGLAVLAFTGGTWLTALWALGFGGTVYCLMPFDNWLGDALEMFTSFHYNASHRVALISAMAVAAGVGALIAALGAGLQLWAARTRRGTEEPIDDVPVVDAGADPAAGGVDDADAAGHGRGGGSHAVGRGAVTGAAAEDAETGVIPVVEAGPTVIEPVEREVDGEGAGAGRAGRVQAAQAAAVIGVTALVMTTQLPAVASAEDQGLQIMAAAGDKAGRVVSMADLRAFDFLRGQVDASPTPFSILSAPEEGMGWGYVTHDLPMVFTHYLNDRQADPLDTTDVLFHADQLNGDPANPVDQAACRLGIRYIVASPPMFWSYLDPYPSFLNLHNAPGLTPVYEENAPDPEDQVFVYEVDSWDPRYCRSVR